MEQTKNIIPPRVVGILAYKDENLIWTCMKTCLKCGLEKPFSEYHAKRNKPQPQCKVCRSKYMAEHYKANKVRINKENKAWYEKNKLSVIKKMRAEYRENPEKFKFARKIRKYGVTKEMFEQMLIEQQNSCAICKDIFGEPHIDHCHESNIVRGLLCAHCNTGLGLFKENEATFKAAIDYLGKYKK